jgi:hypothetical protein
MSAAAAVVDAIMTGSTNESHAPTPKGLSQDKNANILEDIVAHDSKVRCHLIPQPQCMFCVEFLPPVSSLLHLPYLLPLVLNGTFKVAIAFVLLINFLLLYSLHDVGAKFPI